MPYVPQTPDWVSQTSHGYPLLPGRLDLPSSQNFSRPAQAGWITFWNPAGDFNGGDDPLGVFRQVLHGFKQIVLLLWILVPERCDRLGGTPGHDAVDRQSDKVARYAVVGGVAICACKRAWPSRKMRFS